MTSPKTEQFIIMDNGLIAKEVIQLDDTNPRGKSECKWEELEEPEIYEGTQMVYEDNCYVNDDLSYIPYKEKYCKE